MAICRDCHDAIHEFFSLKELEREYSSLESLLSRDTFARAVQFLSRQNPRQRLSTKRPANQRKRGRYR